MEEPLADGVLELEGQTAHPLRSSDEALLARLRRGEAAAFEALVRANQDRVFDFCARMLGDLEEASDLTQEIFVSVHQHLDRFRSDSKLSTWIFRISKNHCLNRLKYLKRRGRGRTQEYEQVPEGALAQAAGVGQSPDEALQKAAERQLVRKAIARLDEEHRLVVALRDIEGLSYEEIAQVAEVPEGTVKSRLHRAREKLVEIFAELELER